VSRRELTAAVHRCHPLLDERDGASGQATPRVALRTLTPTMAQRGLKLRTNAKPSPHQGRPPPPPTARWGRPRPTPSARRRPHQRSTGRSREPPSGGWPTELRVGVDDQNEDDPPPVIRTLARQRRISTERRTGRGDGLNLRHPTNGVVLADPVLFRATQGRLMSPSSGSSRGQTPNRVEPLPAKKPMK
jgi:hypothetical protein